MGEIRRAADVALEFTLPAARRSAALDKRRRRCRPVAAERGRTLVPPGNLRS
ncbi:MAG: hypothetical protein ACREOL_03325 [Candidatus Dormibacteria bacterium]